ncbi:MAG: galactose-1-phosphate uridylyltransferase [Armatimonadota bacterium]|nr:galactose-1-phosphate uridylyltransferase [Armatimonadota bacterium]
MSELRKHPFLGEWIVTATHRQDRTFFPPDDYCPLCPTKSADAPTEIPFESYDIAVFENKFPSFSTPPPEGISTTDFFETLPARGVCEVVCYTQDHSSTFAALGYSRIRNLCEVWKDRYIELMGRDNVEYVFIFENKGREIGVTLTHPHGQIYGYPFVPEVCNRRMQSERDHLARTSTTLAADWLLAEITDGRRIVFKHDGWIAVVPFFARYPYEVHVVPEKHLNDLSQFAEQDLDGLANALEKLTQGYDRLFGFPLPYIMGFYQAREPATRFVAQFTPPHRTADKLKYLAGSEAFCSVFIVDALPEETAAQLRSAC